MFNKRHLAFLVALMLVLAACAGLEPAATGTTIETDPTTTETVAAIPQTTTTALAADVEGALDVGELFITENNSDDDAAVMELMTDDATFANNFSGSVSRDDWTQRLAWNNSQETVLTDPVCELGDVEGQDVKVLCTYGTHDAVSQAVDGPPVPTVTTLTVTPDGISAVFERYSSPDFNYVGNPFEAWMVRNHPEDVAATEFGSWDSYEEAKTNGELVAEYSALWAVYLEAEGCEFTDSDC